MQDWLTAIYRGHSGQSYAKKIAVAAKAEIKKIDADNKQTTNTTTNDENHNNQ